MSLLEIAPYYTNPVQNRADAAHFESVINSVLTPTVTYAKTKDSNFRDLAIKNLETWCSNNTGYDGSEANLYLVYKGQFFLRCAMYLNYTSDTVTTWANIYYSACKNLSKKYNNIGMWALFGMFLVKRFLNQDTSSVLKDAISHIKMNSWAIPLISKKGELWPENLRNNSGMEYTNFSLNPAVMMALFNRDSELPDLVLPLVKTHFEYCKNPDSWGYKAWPGTLLRKIQKVLFPSDDTVLMPTKDNWAGNLLYVVGTEFGIQEYLDWVGDTPVSNSVSMFRYYKELK